MMTQAISTGLREQIKSAETTAQVSDLLTIGSQFEHASAKTKRRWQRTADRRIAEIYKSLEKRITK